MKKIIFYCYYLFLQPLFLQSGSNITAMDRFAQLAIKELSIKVTDKSEA